MGAFRGNKGNEAALSLDTAGRGICGVRGSGRWSYMSDGSIKWGRNYWILWIGKKKRDNENKGMGETGGGRGAVKG